MATIREFQLPDLGEGLEEGEILQWLVQVGDDIALNQTLVEIETAKAVVEVPCPFAGRVVELIGSTGEVLPVGTVILRIDVGASEPAGATSSAGTGLDAAEEPQPLVGYGQAARAAGGRWRVAAPAPASAAPVPAPAPASAPAPAPVTTPVATPGRPLAKPPVRKRARELGIDLASIAPGTGARGEITRADLERASSGTPSPSVQATTVPVARDSDGSGSLVEVGFRGSFLGQRIAVRGVRKHIAEKMMRSRDEIPFASCSRDVDLTDLLALRERLNGMAASEGQATRVTPFALILRATVAALRRFPILNSTFDAEAQEIRIHPSIDLGFAVDSDHGLFVPIIRQAEQRSTLSISSELLELADRAREGRLAPADITGGTFTVSNYGAFGNDDGEPIINHPQAAILGVGAIRARPWVVDGGIGVREVATIRLVFDHRVCDGGEAGRFVSYLGDLCEDPTSLLLHA